MTEPASLKSYGRFECGQEQLFYELVLTQKQYLLKYYNELGKLKMIRPLKIPTEGLEIHTAGNYLFCYMHSFKNQADSEIIITKLDSCLPSFKSCKFHFSCKSAVSKALRLTYFHPISQTFICVDQRQHIYILPNLIQPFSCKKIYENDKMINRIQVNKDKNIVLTSEEKSVKRLVMNWATQQVLNEVIETKLVDYYFQNDYEVYFEDDRPEILNLDRNINLIIKEDGQFPYFLKKDSNLIFYSSKKQFFIVFDTKHHIFVTLIEGIFKTYGEEKEDLRIPAQLKPNNFTVLYKKDKSRNILIELRVYNEITSEFNCFSYNFSEMGRKLSNLSFLKKNIEKVLDINGLIDPLYEQLVQKALIQLDDNDSHFDKSRVLEEINFIDLSISLMKNGFLYFPQEMNRIVQKIKRHIKNVKKTYCIFETKRLFQYCLVIQNQIAKDLQDIYESKDHNYRRGQVHSSIESQSHCKTSKYTQLLSNMIHFLVLMIKELWIQYHHLERQNLDDHQIQTLKNHLRDYEEVRDSSKSIFLIIRLLEDKDIHLKISKAFNNLTERRRQNYRIWQGHLRLVRMEYPPLLLQDHFRNISHLAKDDNNKPTFCQFFHFLLQNRTNFIQVSYFYQYVAKVASVPFLDTDISDLLENILIHTQTIPQKTERYEEAEHQLRLQNLVHKMAGTAIKTRQYTLIKYLIQQAISYKYFPLAVMLIHSQSYQISKEDPLNCKQHIFMVKSLLLAGEFDIAYLYCLKNHSKVLFSQFVRLAKLNGNISDLYQLKLQKKLIEEDDKQFINLLQMTPEQEIALKKIEDEK